MAGESLKSLRRRVRSVKNIKQITRAMEMVSASKLRRAQTVLMAGRPYAAKLQELIANLASGSELGEHPLFAPREGNRKALVIFTADRGLAGSFNVNIIKKAEELLKSEPQTNWRLIVVGRKARDYFQRRRWPIAHSIIGASGQPSSDASNQIAEYLVNLYTSGEVDSIWLLYSAYISTVVYRPTVAQYLPLTTEGLGLKTEEESQSVDYILEPSAEELFNQLLPRYLSSKIYITMAEGATSEHSARMIAMNNATKNCKEIQDTLTLRLNKARQGAITKELLEIVAGAEALKG